MWKWLGAATAVTEPEKQGVSAPAARALTTGSTSPHASQSSSAGSFKRPDSDKSPVVQVTDRICAFVFGKPLFVVITSRSCRMLLSQSTAVDLLAWQPALRPKFLLVQRKIRPHGKKPSICQHCQTGVAQNIIPATCLL